MKLKTLVLFTLLAAFSYSVGLSVDAETRAKSVKATFVSMDGVDKIEWVVSVNIPECGSDLPDSKYKVVAYGNSEVVKIICKEK